MSTVFVFVLSFAVAGAIAWWVHRYEKSREPAPTACSRIIDEVFARGTGDTPDADLLARLLAHREHCIGDPMFVDQLRRLLLNTQQVDEALALLDEAGRHGTFKPDELKAQLAWVNLTAAHQAWVNGDTAKADALRAEAKSAADEIRRRWPEWPLPYLILDEAERSGQASDLRAIDYFQLGRNLRGRVLTGAFIRNLSEWRPAAFVFVVASIGMLGLCAGVSGWLARREMMRMSTSSVASAKPGYVELEGTLHVLPGTDAVIGPESHTPGVWYEVERQTGPKGSSMIHERSSQIFVLRDASGEAVIDPRGMTVRTRHVTVKIRTSGGVSSSNRVTERMLKEDDPVYALGELSVTAAPDGTRMRILHLAENGRRLLVSNLSETQLILIERLWLWIGAAIFVVAVIVLVWAFHQRYNVQAVPGLL